MDLLRAAIKAMYYDFPIESVFGMVVGVDSIGDFPKHLNNYSRDEAPGFSPREVETSNGRILNELKNRNYKKENDLQPFVGLPLYFSEKVLTTDGAGRPLVVFKNLLKWREVVKYIGEDLFTTSYLAQMDETERTDFCWPNVISHDKENINQLLDAGLSDIHSHFGGSIDSFQFNWICLMNDVGKLYDKFNSLKHSYTRPLVYDKEYSFANLSSWCRVAAAIRVCLYNVLIEDENFKKEAVKSSLRALTERGSMALTQLSVSIDALRSVAKRTCDGILVDYALTEGLVTKDNETSPYCVYAGERQIEYAFFRKYLHEPSKLNGALVESFYLYEIIKTHVRREFICANEYIGLDNYIGYSAIVQLFTKSINKVSNVSAIQTSIRQGKNDYIESRITSGTLGLATGDYWKGIYSRKPFLMEDEMRKRLTFVIQLTKGGYDKDTEHREGRYHWKRSEVREQYNTVLRFLESKQSAYEIPGLDVGGMELYYRPEVFAHTLRAAKKENFCITYHVGEEFYDLADGLRAIWEIIQYIKPCSVDRLGHCLALGVPVATYYERKHLTASMSKQMLLDNVVWLCCFANGQGIKIKATLRKWLLELAEDLYRQIGYDNYVGALNMDVYYASMFLRSDETFAKDAVDVWSETAVLKSEEAMMAWNNPKAVKLCDLYNNSLKLIEAGEVSVEQKFSDDYVSFMVKVQKGMIDWVSQAGICIEGCPSSNLQIAQLGRYDCHPAIEYCLNPHKKKKMNFAICTDDKGTFSTSLVNEFSLLALAATKKYGWKKSIETEFAALIEQGNNHRF